MPIFLQPNSADPDIRWASQEAWYVDPATGNDSNAGSVSAPIATWAELMRRWGRNAVKAPISGTVVINIVTGLPSSDPMNFDFILGPETNIRVVGGTPTAVRTGTFTAVTSINRATNTPQDGTDTNRSVEWTPDLSRRVLLTGGAQAGRYAWVAKDLTGKKARFSPFSVPGTASSFGIGVTNGSPSTDAYTVQDLVYCTPGHFRLAHSEPFSNNYPQINFENIWMKNAVYTGVFTPNLANNVQINFYGCRIDPFVQILFGDTFFLNCHFSIGWAFSSAKAIYIRAGLSGSSSSFNHTVAGAAIFDFDHMVQVCGVNVTPGGAMSSGNMCVFDAASNSYNPGGDGIAVGYGDKSRGAGSLAIETQTGGSGAHAVWGAGNAGAGIRVAPGGVASYATTVPTITGTGGDFRLADATQARAFDPTLGIYGALTNSTWALLATAYASAGYGDNAFNPAKGGSIVKLA